MDSRDGDTRAPRLKRFLFSNRSPYIWWRASLALSLSLFLISWYVSLRQSADRKYHSQFGQDRWVLEEVFPGVTDGYFVDIGSADGIRHSNSKALEEAGWQGICVDPFPTNMESRTCQLFQEVVYSSEGESVEFRTAGPLGGIDRHIDVYRDRTSGARMVRFETTTIGSILQRANAPEFIHYLSIDTEGSEYEILSVFPFDQYTLGALSVEHNFVEERRQSVRRLLEVNGYRFVKALEVDDLYVRNK